MIIITGITGGIGNFLFNKFSQSGEQIIGTYHLNKPDGKLYENAVQLDPKLSEAVLTDLPNETKPVASQPQQELKEYKPKKNLFKMLMIAVGVMGLLAVIVLAVLFFTKDKKRDENFRNCHRRSRRYSCRLPVAARRRGAVSVRQDVRGAD